MTIFKRKSADLLDQSPTTFHHVTEYKSSAVAYLTKRVTDRSIDLKADEESTIKTHSSNGGSDSYQMLLPMDSYSCGQESLHSPHLDQPTYTKRDDSYEMCHDHSITAFNDDDPDNESIFSAEHSQDYLYYGAADFRDGCCANSCPKPFDPSNRNGDLRGCGQDCLEGVLGGDGAALSKLDLDGQVAPLAEPELYEDF